MRIPASDVGSYTTWRTGDLCPHGRLVKLPSSFTRLRYTSTCCIFAVLVMLLRTTRRFFPIGNHLKTVPFSFRRCN